MTPKNELLKLLQARKPVDYAAVSVLAQEVGKQMFADLDFIHLRPKQILELGCNTGELTEALAARYPDAEIIALDPSQAMLDYAKQRQAKNVNWTCSSFETLPVPDHSIDLLIANLLLPWCDDLNTLFREWRRVLRPNGLFMLTSLGPDTLHSLQNTQLVLPNFVDMHDVGDVMIAAGFVDPVLNVDYFTLTYRDQAKLLAELQSTGMIAGDISHIQLEKNAEGVYPLVYEIIFGHAWGPSLDADHVADEFGEIRIPLSHIMRR
ncbi:MAG: methyltransferase domain-containing protein [Gammaproteobacteria bacterium]